MSNITITLTEEQVDELTCALEDRIYNLNNKQSVAFAKRLQNKLYGAINKRALDHLIK